MGTALNVGPAEDTGECRGGNCTGRRPGRGYWRVLGWELPWTSFSGNCSRPRGVRHALQLPCMAETGWLFPE